MAKGTRFRGTDWVLQITAALAYGLAYCAVHPFSDGHWSLASGFRLTCLLLVPYRYWAAIAVGEAVPLVYYLWQCLSQFGTITIAVWSVPPIVIAMPVVWYCRRHLGLFPRDRVVDMKMLLLCVLSTSLIWTAITYLGLYLEIEPQRSLDQISPIMIPGLLVGEYVAVLTVATWPVLLKITRSDKSWKSALADAASAPLAIDMWLIALPALAFISFLCVHVDTQSQPIIQMSLFLPTAWLTLKYGWRGTALCSPVSVACVCLLTRSVPDPIVIQTQGFVAFAVTCLFLMGARIASQIYAEEGERRALRNALRVAQQSLNENELRLRQTAHALEIVGGVVSIVQNRVMERARHLLTAEERHRMAKQIDSSTGQIYRLAESMHPHAWRERGVSAALREVIGRALDEAGIAYQFHVQGRGLSQLSPTVHQAIYRIACAAVVTVAGELTCSTIRLTLRGGLTHGRRWAVLRVVGSSDGFDLNNMLVRNGPRHMLAVTLNVRSTGIAAIKDQAALFGGDVHERRADGSVVLDVLLHDTQYLPANESQPARPMRLWVH